MFEFSEETPSKIIAANTTTICPDRSCDPAIWTSDFAEIQNRLVFAIFSIRRNGGQAIRFYPLSPNPSKPPPAFVVVEGNSEFAQAPGTHIAYEHKNFLIIRPLLNIYYRAKWAVEVGNPYYAPGNLRTLARHIARCGIVREEVAMKIEEETDFAHSLIESGLIREAHQACRKILKTLESEREVLKYVF